MLRRHKFNELTKCLKWQCNSQRIGSCEDIKNKIKTTENLPSGKHRAFPIKGDSMLPMKDGAFVVGEFVEDIMDVKDGISYVVVTKNDGLTYKRLYNQLEEKGTLLLKPDNRDYEPYEIPANEILELWKFTCAINTQEYDEKDLKLSSIIQMFNELKVELKSLEK